MGKGIMGMVAKTGKFLNIEDLPSTEHYIPERYKGGRDFPERAARKDLPGAGSGRNSKGGREETSPGKSRFATRRVRGFCLSPSAQQLP